MEYSAASLMIDFFWCVFISIVIQEHKWPPFSKEALQKILFSISVSLKQFLAGLTASEERDFFPRIVWKKEFFSNEASIPRKSKLYLETSYEWEKGTSKSQMKLARWLCIILWDIPISKTGHLPIKLSLFPCRVAETPSTKSMKKVDLCQIAQCLTDSQPFWPGFPVKI